MDIYVARQPIFDRQQKVIGYELLYRTGLTNSCNVTDGTEASLAVIRNTFLMMGERMVAPPGKAFIKLTRDLLMNGVAKVLPQQSTVLEISEETGPDKEVVDVCRELKEAGYTLTFDDCTVDTSMKTPLLELADIVKVDFTKNSKEQARIIARKLANGKRQLLAERVETRDELTAALAMGYSFFQGYFFSKPVIMQGHAIPYYKRNYMRIMRELSRRELDFEAFEGIIKQDVTLCYTLLKYINSAYFRVIDEVTSVLRAIVLLGEAEVRRWASLVLCTLMGTDDPPEVVVRSLVRARMCELLAADIGLRAREPDLFLMGLFSMLDVLIGLPLAEILKGLSLSREVKGALLGQQTDYRRLYELVVSYERGQWERCTRHASELNLNPEIIPSVFLSAVEWADQTTKIGNLEDDDNDAQPALLNETKPGMNG
jgi:c-di-GMP-related signal transduction protein